MTEAQKKQLEQQLWNIANQLRGKMNADEFRDYCLGFIFYKYLSDKLHQPERGITSHYLDLPILPGSVKNFSIKALEPCSTKLDNLPFKDDKQVWIDQDA